MNDAARGIDRLFLHSRGSTGTKIMMVYGRWEFPLVVGSNPIATTVQPVRSNGLRRCIASCV
jgi:hypothetical protein